MGKFKSFLKRHKNKLTVAMTGAAVSALSAVSVFAAEGDSSLQTTFSDQISTIQTDVFGYIAIALPVGLAIFGAVLAIKKGISFIRSLIGRG